MWPFSREDARAFFEGVAAEVEQSRRLLVAAFDDGELVGTVQVILALPPNQPHPWGDHRSCSCTGRRGSAASRSC